MTSLMAFLAVFALSQPQSSAVQPIAQTHLHWSSKRAHELSPNHTLANTPNVTDADRNTLIGIVTTEFSQLDNDHQYTPNELRHFASATRIELLDLNGDGVPEVLLQGSGDRFACGATGNCFFMILQKYSAGYKKILNTWAKGGVGSIQLISVDLAKTNGYLNLTLAAHESVAEKSIYALRYSNGKYRKTACYTASWISENDPTVGLNNPTLTPCSE